MNTVTLTGMLLVCVLASGPSAFANGSEVGLVGGSVLPLESSSIELVSERVTADISLEGHHAEVRCAYLLHNLSPSRRTLRMGFLTSVPWPREIGDSSYAGFWDEGRRIHVSQQTIEHWEARELPVLMVSANKEAWKEYADSPPDSMPTWILEFDGDQAITLFITYQASILEDEFVYQARPATLWAGPIDVATIEFHIGEVPARLLRCLESSASANGCVRVSVEPPGYEWTNFGLVWRYANWEPAEDLRLTIDWGQD